MVKITAGARYSASPPNNLDTHDPRSRLTHRTGSVSMIDRRLSWRSSRDYAWDFNIPP